MTHSELEGVLSGKALPSDLRVGESLSAYFGRKFIEADFQRSLLIEDVRAIVIELGIVNPTAKPNVIMLSALAGDAVKEITRLRTIVQHADSIGRGNKLRVESLKGDAE